MFSQSCVHSLVFTSVRYGIMAFIYIWMQVNQICTLLQNTQQLHAIMKCCHLVVTDIIFYVVGLVSVTGCVHAILFHCCSV